MGAVVRQVQQVVPDELLLLLLVSWLAPAQPTVAGGGLALADQREEQLDIQACSADVQPQMPAASAAQSWVLAAVAGAEVKSSAFVKRPGLLLPPDAATGCSPSRSEASASLEGDAVCFDERLDDANKAAPPASKAAGEAAPAGVTVPLSICCRRALSLPLPRDEHRCGGGSPSTGRAPLQVRVWTRLDAKSVADFVHDAVLDCGRMVEVTRVVAGSAAHP